jgi:hypothetical protein
MQGLTSKLTERRKQRRNSPQNVSDGLAHL